MATTYNGKPGNETRAATVNIASSTNASPIVVTTSAAHGLLEGDRVQIIGHATNTAANGIWYVHYLTSTTFSLYSAWSGGAVSTASTGNGVGGATGTVAYLGLMPRSTIPDDGVDLRTASALNVPNEDAKDSQAWLSERTGIYRWGQYFGGTIFSPASPGSSFSSRTAPSGSWGTNADVDGIIGAAYLDMVPGDVLEIDFATTANTSLASTSVAFKLAYELVEYGAARTGTPTGDLTAALTVSSSAVNGTPYMPLTLRGFLGNFVSGRGKKVYIYLQAYGLGGAVTYSLFGSWQIAGRVWRLN